MHPFFGAILGGAFTAIVAAVVYLIRSKSKDTAEEVFDKKVDSLISRFQYKAEDVFRSQITGALAIWEQQFRERCRGEGFLELTARDYIKISDAMKAELNGRYMMAPEARREFKDLRELMDTNTERLHVRISRLGDEFDQKLVRFDDRLNEKADRQ